jgi:hypothetical protein
MDVTKIRVRCYQFTAVDDCTRLRVLRLYPSKHSENTVKFLYEVIESFLFPIPRILGAIEYTSLKSVSVTGFVSE